MAAIIKVTRDYDLFAPVLPYQDVDVIKQTGFRTDVDLFAPPVVVLAEQEIVGAD